MGFLKVVAAIQALQFATCCATPHLKFEQVNMQQMFQAHLQAFSLKCAWPIFFKKAAHLGNFRKKMPVWGWKVFMRLQLAGE